MQLEAGALSGCVGGKCGPGKQEHPRDWEKLAVLCIWDPESSSDRPSSLHTKGLEVTSCSLEHTESPVMASKYHPHRRKPALPESTASPGLGRKGGARREQVPQDRWQHVPGAQDSLQDRVLGWTLGGLQCGWWRSVNPDFLALTARRCGRVTGSWGGALSSICGRALCCLHTISINVKLFHVFKERRKKRA